MATPSKILLRLAWRNLWRNRRRTLVMLAAIMLGVWSMIFLNALTRGMVEQMLIDGIRAMPGEVQIHHPDYRDDPSVVNSMPAPDGALLEALARPPVTGWTGRVKVPAMISSERENRGVILLGIDPTSEAALGFRPQDIVDGRYLEGVDDTGLIIGRKLVERLETRLGKRVVVMSQDPENNVADRGFRIVGVYQATLPAQEEMFIYAGRSTVQAMLGIGTGISELAVSASNFREPAQLLQHLQAAADPALEVLDWKEIDSYLGLMVDMMDGFILVFVILIYVVLGFGLANTLMMAVFERIREIGLMQALGMTPASILVQILLESTMLLLVGLIAGTALGVVSLLPLRDGIDLSAVAQGMEMMGSGAVLYPSLTAQDLLIANLVVLVLGILTSLFPAWRGSRYRPVEAIARG
ncbi:MAG: FtsX-like permease family protein [Xanthomonadales bacterium]|nr:FtsX-like permease family protein [Xanthomonadales bacterium]